MGLLSLKLGPHGMFVGREGKVRYAKRQIVLEKYMSFTSVVFQSPVSNFFIQPGF